MFICAISCEWMVVEKCWKGSTEPPSAAIKGVWNDIYIIHIWNHSFDVIIFNIRLLSITLNARFCYCHCCWPCHCNCTRIHCSPQISFWFSRLIFFLFVHSGDEIPLAWFFSHISLTIYRFVSSGFEDVFTPRVLIFIFLQFFFLQFSYETRPNPFTTIWNRYELYNNAEKQTQQRRISDQNELFTTNASIHLFSFVDVFYHPLIRKNHFDCDVIEWCRTMKGVSGQCAPERRNEGIQMKAKQETVCNSKEERHEENRRRIRRKNKNLLQIQSKYTMAANKNSISATAFKRTTLCEDSPIWLVFFTNKQMETRFEATEQAGILLKIVSAAIEKIIRNGKSLWKVRSLHSGSTTKPFKVKSDSKRSIIRCLRVLRVTVESILKISDYINSK